MILEFYAGDKPAGLCSVLFFKSVEVYMVVKCLEILLDIYETLSINFCLGISYSNQNFLYSLLLPSGEFQGRSLFLSTSFPVQYSLTVLSLWKF